MTLPTEFPHMPSSVGAEPEDGRHSRGGAAVLASFQLHCAVEWMTFCPICQKETRFLAEIELANGLFGTCVNCGDQRVMAYTRSVE